MVRALARTAVGVVALAAALSGCRTAPQPTIIGPGADVMARMGDEATLLQLAAELEQAQPWFDRLPALTREAP